MNHYEELYKLLININEVENILLKTIYFISERKIIKKLNSYIYDIFEIKNHIYSILLSDIKNDDINPLLLNHNYNEYKKMMKFL